jgi:hypothetical protein
MQSPFNARRVVADAREFDLLASEDDAQTFVQHEVQTSPLVSRDALDIGEHVHFAQRGLLGSVLSVHAKALPIKPHDRRIYMNLDAPSSGLVCGVQVSIIIRFYKTLPNYLCRDQGKVIPCPVLWNLLCWLMIGSAVCRLHWLPSCKLICHTRILCS